MRRDVSTRDARASTRRDAQGYNAYDTFADTIVQDTLAGAGLAVARDDVHGAGLLSYPGEGLVKDGLSYVANAVHNI